MNRQVQLALFFTLLSVAFAGRVYPWGEPWISNPNKNYVKTIDLYFSLDNPLPNGHVIRIQFPFANVLTFSTVKIFPVTTTRGPASVAATPSTAWTLGTALVTAAAPYNYYWAVTNALTAATNYAIRFQISSVISDSPGFLGYIQFETMSPAQSVTTSLSASDIAITYDSNNAFAPIHLFDAPVTATFNAASSDTNALVASATYVRQFRFSLTRDFFYWPLITISWDNKDFSITNCVNADIGTGSGVAVPLAPSQYTCTLSQVTTEVAGVSTVTGGMYTILHNNQIPKSTTIVYNFTIANPQNGGTINFNMQVMHRYNMNLTDISSSAQSWTVTQPATNPTTTTASSVSINNQKILLSWGIDPSVITATQRKIFNIHTTGSTIKSFQALRFVFGTNATLATGNYTVTIGVCTTQANCDVLENSIVTTLPGSCSASLGSPTRVICANVTTIATTSNIIAARIWLKQDGQILDTSQSPVPLVNDTGFGTYRIESIAASTTAGVTTYTSSVTATATSSSPYTGGFQEATNLLANVNGNGPLVGFADSATYTAFKTFTDWTGAAGGAVTLVAGDKFKLLGGVYGHTTGSTTAYNLILAMADKFDKTFATNTKTIFGTGTKESADKFAGIDFFLNPNIWALGTASGGKCFFTMTPDQAAATTLPDANTGLHCYSISATTTGASWTRLRAIVITATSTVLTGADAKTKLLSFVWEGYAALVNYSGACLKADTSIADYYAAFYLINSAATGLTNAVASPTADAGELGSTAMTAGGTDGFFTKVFFSAPIFSPATSGSLVNTFVGGYHVQTGGANKISAWLQGYGDTSVNSNSGLTFLRIRWTPVSADPMAPNGKLAIFWQVPSGGTSQISLVPVAPSTLTATAGNTRCFAGGITYVCNMERPGRTLNAWTGAGNAIRTEVNTVDYYQVFTSTVAWAVDKEFALSFAIQPKSGYVAAGASTKSNFRIGSVSASDSSKYWINGWDILGAVDLSNGAPTTTSAGTTSCANGSTTLTPGIRMVSQASDVVNTVITTGEQFVVSHSSNANAQQTAGPKLGGFVFCVQGTATYTWDFRSSSFAINSTAFETTTDKCAAFDFLSAEATPYTFVCIYCPFATGTASTTAAQYVSATNFKTANAVDFINPSFGNVYGDTTAYLVEKQQCNTITALYTPATATISTSGSAYTVNGQKVTLSLGAPTTLNGIGIFTVTGYNNSAADSTFPQGSLDSAGICRLVPTALLSDPTKFETTCVPTVTNGVITFTWTSTSALAVANANVTQWTFILWGLNGNTPAATPVLTATYYATTIRSTSSAVDRSPMSSQAVLASWTYTNGLSNALTTSNIQYQRPLLGARGYFRWDFSFPSWRPWFFNDKLVFNLDAVITSSANNNIGVVKCRITDANDVIQQYFRSCTLTPSVPSLTIVAVNVPIFISATATGVIDFPVTASLRVYLDNMVTIALQTVKTIYGTLTFSGQSTGASTSLSKASTVNDMPALSALATSQAFTTSPTITKYWPSANQLQDLVFGMTTSMPLNDSCRITIVFPSYYNHDLNTKSHIPVCTVNGQATFCVVDFPRSLRIEGFPTSLASGTSFTIRVVGVAAPTTTFSIENFWIAINQDKSESTTTTTFAGTLSDTNALTTALPAPIHVNWHSVSTTNTRTTATWTWAFTTLAAQTHDTTKVIQVIFPDSWAIAQGYSLPVCSIADWSSSVVYSSTQTQIGNVIGLNVTTTFNGTAIVLLTCNTIRTPEPDSSTYPSQDIQIRLVDASGATSSYISSPSVHNVNYNLGFTRAVALQTINWAQASSLVAPLILTRGTYSVQLTLNLPSTRSTKVFQVATTNSQFGFFPAPVNVTTGLTTLSSLLGCATSVPVNYYVLTFTITDSTTYTIPQSVAVLVQATKLSFSISPALSTDITALYSSTTSRTLPVVFDASNVLPFSDVTVTPNFAAGNTNFTVTPGAITLTPNSPISWFVYSTTSSTTATGNVQVTYTLSGTNAASYGTVLTSGVVTNLIVGNQNVKVIADTTSQATLQPTLTITADSTDTLKATTKVITFNLGAVTSASVYWVVGLAGQLVTDTNTIQSMAAAQVPYNPMSSNQAQYMITSQIATPKSPAYVVISKLFPNTVYDVKGFANSLTNQNSTVASFTFTTGTNTATLTRWLYNYTTYPTTAQRQALLCALISYLAVPQVNIWSINGETCGNTTAFYQGQNSTGDVAIYFYPLQVETDTVTNNLALTLNTTAAITAINNTASANGLAGFTNIIPDGNPRNILLTPSWPSASAGLTYITLSGVTLNDTGFVYAVLDTNSSSTPAQAVMKNPAIQANYSFIATQTQFYSASVTGALTFNFTGLSQNTGYKVYLCASNNDPSFLQNFTAVTPLTVNTLAPQTNIVSAFALASSLLVALISAISMLMI